MHGYQANLELERRQVQDWAGISRPQVYYSLEKLARFGFLREAGDPEAALGPERRIFATTAKGRAALSAALEREDWTTNGSPALSHLDGAFLANRAGQYSATDKRRRRISRPTGAEEETLHAVEKEVGHRFHEAVWMISLIDRTVSH